MLRLIFILYLTAKYGLILLLAKYDLKKIEKPKLFRKFFEEASGTFIKFGQLLALRVDIVSKEFSTELLGLFDDVKPFSYKEIERTFLQELGATPQKIFKQFEKEPFASASFGQVHGAKLKDNSVVIVKVLRPGIEERAEVDFIIIDFFASIADLFFKIDALSWTEFASEFKHWTKQEFDYRIEAENGQRLYQNNLDSKNLLIPKIYHELTTKKILVEQYVEGVHLSRLLKQLKNGTIDEVKLKEMGIDLKKTAHTLIWELQKQFFFHEFYHADPHPGNIILLKNGRVALIDFGIVGGERLPNKKYFVKWAKATGNYNFKEASFYAAHFSGDQLKTMIRSALPATVGEKAIDDLIRLLADHFAETTQNIILDNNENLKTLKKDYLSLLLKIIKTAEKYKIRLPKQFVVFSRSLGVFGLLAKHMDKDFSVTAAMKEFFLTYPEDVLTKNDEEPFLRRINREVALERLGNWLSYLFEIDPPVYHLVNNYLKKYNLFDS